MAAPIPLEAPVTTATFPVSFPITSPLPAKFDSTMTFPQFDEHLTDDRAGRKIQERCGNLEPGKRGQIILPYFFAQLHMNELRGLAYLNQTGLGQLFNVMGESRRMYGQSAAHRCTWHPVRAGNA